MRYRTKYAIASLALAIIVAAFVGIAVVRAATVLFPIGGGTGTSTAPTYGQVLVGNTGGTYTLTATSSLGISGGGGGNTGLATTSPWTSGSVAYVVDNGHVSSVSTSTLTASSPLTGSFTHVGTGGSLGIQVANTSQNGYLSSTDWNTFNGKQAAGNYITALTGDVAASGPGSAAATLATVNSNVGTFTYPSVTVNGKGLITAIANGITPALFAYLFPSNATSTLLTFNGGLTAANTVTFSGITGSTQCLTVNSTGVVSGTGSPCGSGSGSVSSVSATYPIISSGGTTPNISTAFGTTTNNVYSGTNTFNNGATTTSLSIGSLSGFLKATSGLVSTALINLASDVTGTLPVANGGTGSTTLTGILKGNGTGQVQTAIPGTDYLVGNQTITLSGAVTGSGTTAITTTYAGTLPVNLGGTGTTTLGGILAGNGASGIKSAVIGSGLSFNGTTLSATGGTSPIATSSREIANYLPKWTSTSGTPALLAGTSILYDTGSELRIGTTTNYSGNSSRVFVWGGPAGANIDLMGDPSVIGGDTGNVEIESSDYYKTPSSIYMNYNNIGFGSTLGFPNQHLAQLVFNNASTSLIYTTGATPLIFGTNFTEGMRLDALGNLGIGTTSPGSLLSIGNTGGINFSTATSSFSTTGGINLKSGCFAVAGTCIGGAAGTNYFTLTGNNLQNNVGNAIGINVAPTIAALEVTASTSTSGSLALRNSAGAVNDFFDSLGMLQIGTSTVSDGGLNLIDTNSSGCVTSGHPSLDSLVIGGNPGGDTDYWICRNANNDGITNDMLQFGTGLVPGTSSIFGMSINTAGTPFFTFGTTTQASNSGITEGSSATNSNTSAAASNAASFVQLNSNSTDGTLASNDFRVYDGSGASVLAGRFGVINESHSTGAASGDFFISLNNAGTIGEKVHLTAAGNFGIGTTSPGTLLSVGNTGGISLTLATSTWNTTGGLNINSGCYAFKGTCLSTGGFSPIGTTGQFPYFSASNTLTATSSLFLAASGFVGVGTTTPLGNLAIQSLTNNVHAFSVSNAAGSDVFNVDTTASSPFLGVGSTYSTSAVFSVGSTTATVGVPNFEIDTTGHVVTSGLKPTVSSCGTTNSNSGNDSQGSIMFTGTVVSTCTLTFVTPVPAGQTLGCTSSDNSLTGFSDISSTSTTAVTFGISTGLAAGTIYYNCSRWQ